MFRYVRHLYSSLFILQLREAVEDLTLKKLFIF